MSRNRVNRPGCRTRLEVESLEDRRVPATLTVTTKADEVVRDQRLSLREAIKVVNTGSLGGLSAAESRLVQGPVGSRDTIRFDSRVFGSGEMITLDGSELRINRSVAIQASRAGVTVSGDGESRVFSIGKAATVTLTNLTVTEGAVELALAWMAAGGGIHNQGTLTLNGCTVEGNSAVNATLALGLAKGGGIYNTGTLTVNDSKIRDNSALSVSISGVGATLAQGGGVYNLGKATFTNSTVEGNSAVCVSLTSFMMAHGGGIANSSKGTLVLRGTSVRDNDAWNSPNIFRAR